MQKLQTNTDTGNNKKTSHGYITYTTKEKKVAKEKEIREIERQEKIKRQKQKRESLPPLLPYTDTEDVNSAHLPLGWL